MNGRSISFRLVAWHAAISLLVCGSFGLYVYFGLSYFLQLAQTDTLQRRAHEVAAILAAHVGREGEPYTIDLIKTSYAPENNDRFIRIRRPDGSLLYVSGEPTDKAAVEKTLREEIPQVLDYLEAQIPSEGFIFGEVSIADISIACFFRNAAFARFKIDPARWPRTAALVECVLNLQSFRKLEPIEDRLLRTPLRQHRTVLAEMGMALTGETYGTAEPRRGIMRID